MATPVLSPTSATIPNGGTADVAVAWTLDPGTPDQSGHLKLTAPDGTVLIDAPVTLNGRPAEQPPRLVTANPGPGDVLITCDVAAVTLIDQQTIRLA